MKKFFLIFAVPILMLTGCARTETVPASKQLSVTRETVSVTEPEPETEETALSQKSAEQNENQFIYDECNALTEEIHQQYENRLATLSASCLLHTAIVLTDNLDGNAPQQFAEIRYHQLFDTDSEIPDGFLLLINNDTGQDYFYTTGRCSLYMPETEKTAVIYRATPALIEKDYGSALEQILSLTLKIPPYVIDRTGTLTLAEIQEFSDKISELENPCAVVLRSFPQKTEELPETYYLEKMQTDSVLFLDPAKKQCRIAGKNNPKLEEEILKVWNEQSLPWAVRCFLEKI